MPWLKHINIIAMLDHKEQDTYICELFLFKAAKLTYSCYLTQRR